MELRSYPADFSVPEEALAPHEGAVFFFRWC